MEEILKRKENEDDFEYKIRLCVAKLNKEINLDWIELVELLNLNCSSDHLRKLSYAYKEYYDYNQNKKEKSISDIDMLKKLEEKKIELEKERKKLQTTKIEYNRNLRKDSRFELFYENIRDAKDRLPLPVFEKTYCKNEYGGEYVLSIADIHYGANFKAENNFYNREKVKRQFELLLAKTERIIKKNGISKITVIGLGDFIQGMLRISDVSLNDIPVVDSVVEISRIMATFLNELSSCVYVTYRHTMGANHSQCRYLGTKANEMPKEDMEHIIGNYIKDLVSNNKRIDVVLSEKDYDTFELCGQKILTMHGHQIKDVKSAIKDFSTLHRTFYDICFIGHLHGGQSISVGETNGNTEIIVCPSFVGSDPYSDKLQVGSKAMCKLFKIEEEQGITETYTIILN